MFTLCFITRNVREEGNLFLTSTEQRCVPSVHGQYPTTHRAALGCAPTWHTDPHPHLSSNAFHMCISELLTHPQINSSSHFTEVRHRCCTDSAHFQTVSILWLYNGDCAVFLSCLTHLECKLEPVCPYTKKHFAHRTYCS